MQIETTWFIFVVEFVLEILAWIVLKIHHHGNTIREMYSSCPRQNGHKITDDNFKCNIINENGLVFIFFSLKSIPWGMIDEKSSLV